VTPLDVSVAKLAARQRGLVHRDQALALGMTQRQYQARTASGLYVPCQPRVVRQAAAPIDWEQRVLAACMSAGSGAGASHRSAAVLWRLRGLERAPVEITAPIGRTPHLTDVVLHRAPTVDLLRYRGIPVTTAASTLLVLGSVVDAAVLESAVEDAILRRLTTFERLVEMVERLGRSGRDGTAALRRLLDERGPGAATESVLEDLMAALLRRAGIDDFERQHAVGGVRLDFACPGRKLGIEVNGLAFHSAAHDLQRDWRKLNRLLALGWRILQFTWADIRYRPDDVLAQLATTMAA
jgi:very-short-patch-repair endonuclease